MDAAIKNVKCDGCGQKAVMKEGKGCDACEKFFLCGWCGDGEGGEDWACEKCGANSDDAASADHMREKA